MTALLFSTIFIAQKQNIISIVKTIKIIKMETKNYLQRFIYGLQNKIQQSEQDWKGSRFASPADSDSASDDEQQQQQYEEYLEKYRGKNGDIKPLGLVLYYRYMKNLAVLFLILTLISLPRILLYYSSGGLSQFQTSKSFSQVILQISIANLPHYHIDNLSESDLREIEIYRYLTIGTDVLSVLIIMFFILYWKVLSTKISNEYTAQSPSPHLYCLEISKLENIPEEQISDHFGKFGKVAQVSYVYRQKDILIGLRKLVKKVTHYMNIRKNQKKKKQIKQKLKTRYDELAYEYLSGDQPQIKSCFLCFQKIKTRNRVLDLYKYKIHSEKLMIKNSMPSVKKCSFEPLTINWQNYHVQKKSQTLKFIFQSFLLLIMIFVILVALFLLNINSTHIKENSGFEDIEDSVISQLALKTQDPKMLYAFCDSLTYETFKWEYYDMCSAYFTFEKNKFVLMLLFSSLVAVINLLTNRILWALVAFRRYKTLVDRNQFLITSIFLFSLINSAILILMIRGQYTGPILRSIIGYLFNFKNQALEVTVYAQFNRQWYMNIGSQLIMNYIVSLIVFPHFHIILHWIRKIYRNVTEKKTGKPMKNPNFNYCTFYAMSLKAMFFAMLYSNSMPIFYFLCFLAFCVQVGVGKFLLKHFVDEPVFVDNNAIDVATNLIPYCLILHCLTSILFLNVQQFFPTSDSYAKINNNWFEGNLNKFTRGVVYIILSIFILFFIFNRERVYKILTTYWLGRDQSKFECKQNKQFTQLAKNPAFLSSYKMKDNPKYKILHSALFLFEIHMKEVKNRMDNREIKSREDQMTAIPLRVQNLSIEERINENEGIEFDEENYDIDIDYIVEEVSQNIESIFHKNDEIEEFQEIRLTQEKQKTTSDNEEYNQLEEDKE